MEPQAMGPSVGRVAELGNFFAELANLALQVRQAIEDGDGAAPVLVVKTGRAGIDRACGNVAVDGALRGENCAIVNGEMSGRCRLSGENTFVADVRSAGEPNLAAENRIFADRAGMPHLHEIVDLGATADGCVSDGAAINGAVRLNLDVVTDDDAPHL